MGSLWFPYHRLCGWVLSNVDGVVMRIDKPTVVGVACIVVFIASMVLFVISVLRILGVV